MATLTTSLARFPLRYRRRTSDLEVFRQVFVQLGYACLDDVPGVETIVDCGANVGYSAAYFLSRFPSSRLVAIEPDANNYAVLAHNLRPYRRRATVIRSAIWPEPVGLVMERRPYRDGRDWSRQVRSCGAYEQPAFRAIDIPEAMKRIDAKRISILKVDIEGAEGELFRKGCETWLDLVDNIVVELHDDSVFGNCTAIFHAAIAGRGFEIVHDGDRTVCKRGATHGAGSRVQGGADPPAASPRAPRAPSVKGRRRAGASPAPGRHPRVSVVIPYRDDGERILDAVASAETCPRPYEIVVVNDGSQDALSLRVLDFLRQRDVTVMDQHGRGLPAARNSGFARCRAPVVVPLDADNRLRPGFVSAALAVLESRSDVAVVYGDRCEFGNRTGTVQVADFDLLQLVQGNYIDACAAVRKAAWEDCGGYDEQMLDGWEDWDLWLRVAVRDWVFEHLSMPAFDYCVRNGSMSARIMQPEVGRPLQEYLVRKHEALYRRFLPQLLEQAQESLLLREEVERWKRRVEAMETTRAWRLRSALLRWRARLRRR